MYRIELGRRAAADLERVHRADRTLYKRFLNAFQLLAGDPEQGKALHGNLRGLRSYRFGSYRILYEILHARLVVVVVDLGHRRDIYR